MRREEDLASALASALLALELVAQLRDETGATSLATPGVVLTRTSFMQKNKKTRVGQSAAVCQRRGEWWEGHGQLVALISRGGQLNCAVCVSKCECLVL